MYTVEMALYDFVPVIGFLVGGIYLVKLSRLMLKKFLSIIMTIGVIVIVMGGGLQASWKLLTAINLPHPIWMSQGQFVFMATGYVLVLIPVLALLRKNKAKTAEALPAMATWKIPFLGVMTLASLSAYASLVVLSLRRKSWLAGLGFVAAFISVLTMGFMASQNQTIQMQWIEQTINTLGNWGFALGAILVYNTYKPRKNK